MQIIVFIHTIQGFQVEVEEWKSRDKVEIITTKKEDGKEAEREEEAFEIELEETEKNVRRKEGKRKELDNEKEKGCKPKRRKFERLTGLGEAEEEEGELPEIVQEVVREKCCRM